MPKFPLRFIAMVGLLLFAISVQHKSSQQGVAYAQRVTPTPCTLTCPTATSTATATATTTITATPPRNAYLPFIRGSSPVILPNYNSWVSIGGFLHVVGEVQNQTKQNIELVKITVNFFDANNQIVATNSTYLSLDVLPAGEKSCFDLLPDPPASWTHFEFEPLTFYVTDQILPNLALVSNSGFATSGDNYRVVGQIRNNESVQVNFVSAVTTLYDAQNRVVDCDPSVVSSTNLTPGQTSSFQSDFFSKVSYSDVTSYRVQVDGYIP